MGSERLSKSWAGRRVGPLLAIAWFLLQAAVVMGQKMPDDKMLKAWCGFPESLKMEVQKNDGDAAAWGKLLQGRIYHSGETRFDYEIVVFAPGTLFKEKRKEILELISKMDAHPPKTGTFWDDLGTYTNGSQTFYIMPLGMGPGGGANAAFAFGDQYDLLVTMGHGDEGHPLDKKHEEGAVPTARLPELFKKVVQFFIDHPPVVKAAK